MLGYGLTKTKMLIITGELRSLKDGRSRRVLPEWVDEYVARKRRARARLMTARASANGEGSIFPYRNGYAAYAWVTTPAGLPATQVRVRADPRGRPCQMARSPSAGSARPGREPGTDPRCLPQLLAHPDRQAEPGPGDRRQLRHVRPALHQPRTRCRRLDNRSSRRADLARTAAGSPASAARRERTCASQQTAVLCRRSLLPPGRVAAHGA